MGPGVFFFKYGLIFSVSISSHQISINLSYVGFVFCFDGDWQLIASWRNWDNWDNGWEYVVIRTLRCFFPFFLSFLSWVHFLVVPFMVMLLFKLEIVCCLYVHCRVVETICTLVRNLPPNSSSAALMSMCVKILGKLLKWYMFLFGCSGWIFCLCLVWFFTITYLTFVRELFMAIKRNKKYYNLND